MQRLRYCDFCCAISEGRQPTLCDETAKDGPPGCRFLSWLRLLCLDLFVPGVGLLEGVVHVVDVFYAGGVEPVFEGLFVLVGVDRDAVFPGGAAAEDSVEA